MITSCIILWISFCGLLWHDMLHKHEGDLRYWISIALCTPGWSYRHQIYYILVDINSILYRNFIIRKPRNLIQKESTCKIVARFYTGHFCLGGERINHAKHTAPGNCWGCNPQGSFQNVRLLLVPQKACWWDVAWSKI